MNIPIIKLSKIKKVYNSEILETHALQGVDIEIEQGEFLSICGASGCGKSTLLTILGLLDSPTSGEYYIEGKEVSNLSNSEAAYIRNSKIGFVFQSFNLIDELSVYDNVALPLRYRKERLRESEIKTRVMACIAKVGLEHRALHKPNQLSGGQQQRVSIARALVNDPSILLVDEPTGNLDSENGEIVMKTLQDLNNEGTTLCMVTHEPRFAQLAKRQLKLIDGKIG